MAPPESIDIRGVDDGRASLLAVRAQPGARRKGVAGTWNGHLKLAVTAAPEGGRANVALVSLAAKLFGVRPSAIELVRGHSSRRKELRIELPPDELRRRIAALLAP